MSSYRRRMMQKQEDRAIDLSLQDIYGNPINRSTANCYVVRETGQYKFPLVYGNAIKNGKENTAAFTNNGGIYSHDFVDGQGNGIIRGYIMDVYAASVWASMQLKMSVSDTNSIITGLNLTQESDGRHYINFQVDAIPDTGANAILSLSIHGTSIIWCWHIWLWPHDLTPVEITNRTGVKYNIMPVNLASKYDADGVHIKNWFYQWGRPNPMLLPSAWNSATNHTPGSITKASKAEYLSLGLSNPTWFYYNSASPYNWFGDKSYYNLWDAACTGTGTSDNDTVKTIYDPCPVGWKVPNGNTFTGLSILSSANGIVKMRRYSGDTVGVGFPLSSRRSYTNGSIWNAGNQGFVWHSSSVSQEGASITFFSTSFVAFGSSDETKRAYGASIRPVEDDNIQLDVIMISFTILGSDGKSVQCQAESGMTWFEWIHSSYNTVGVTISPNGLSPRYQDIDIKDDESVYDGDARVHQTLKGGYEYWT